MGSTASEPMLLTDQGDDWVRLTLNRPSRRNALNLPLMQALNTRLDALHNQPPALVILDGNGPHFCAGADLAWMATSVPETGDAPSRQFKHLLYQLDTLPALTVACVHGATLGGGVGLLACCDRVIADPHSRIRLPELSLGLIPALILPYLYRCIGERACRDWCLSGRTVDAEEARQAGPFQQLHPKERFAEMLTSIMESANTNSREALQDCKRWILAQRQLAPHDAAREAVHWLAGMRRHADTQRRIRAFLDTSGK